MLHTAASDIVFTSGGTEANNWIIKDAVTRWQRLHPEEVAHVVTSNIEHDSVEHVLRLLEQQGQATVTRLAAQSNGAVSVQDLVASLKPTTCLVTVMLANNETGVLQPVAQLMAAVTEHEARTKTTVVKHTDAAQVQEWQ